MPLCGWMGRRASGAGLWSPVYTTPKSVCICFLCLSKVFIEGWRVDMFVFPLLKLRKCGVKISEKLCL